MREIKFRAWDGKKMWLVVELQFAKGNLEFIEQYGTDVGYLIRGIDRKGNKFVGVCPDGDTALMQYTGLKDKNGVEIYEGDIINVSHPSLPEEADYNKEVKWETGYMVGTGFSINLSFSECSVVIGNIYENGDLLND